MESLINHIAVAGETIFQVKWDAKQIQFQETRKEFEGDTTLVAFPLAKTAGKNPEELGNALGAYLQENVDFVESFNVVKGFLNIRFSDHYWLTAFEQMRSAESWGWATPNSKPRIMVEYSSPNTNKPLHLGHLRNNFLGYAVAELLKANGHSVTKVQIINDRGIHICKSMWAWKNLGNGETPQSSGMKGDKLVGKYYVEFDKTYKSQITDLMSQGKTKEEAESHAPCMMEAQDMLRAWEAGDEGVVNLWKTMNQWVYEGFNATYQKMGVDFDQLYFESQTYLKGRNEVMKGLENGVFFQKEDGSIWIDLTDEGLDQKALLRKDGTAMYITQDIGTAILRFEDYPDTVSQIYTVGNEQEYHFKVLFKVLKKLGWPQSEACHHLSYGMVELPEGKMKSREGTVVDADDLMEEMCNAAKEVSEEQGKLSGLVDQEKVEVYEKIGMAALKYFLLRVDPKKNMMFNPQESIDFNGNTGPFIQYGYVRTQAIKRKAAEVGIVISDKKTKTLHVSERELIKLLYQYPAMLQSAADLYDPSVVANYAYEVVRQFNAFYQNCSILREEDEAARSLRLELCALTGDCVQRSMSILGVQMPDRM